MINEVRQRILLHLFESKELRVTSEGVIELYYSGKQVWKPVRTFTKKSGHSLRFRKHVYGITYELPVAAAVLLWKVRRVLPVDYHVGYEDGDPTNTRPDNICTINKWDYYEWVASLRHRKKA